MRRAHNFGSRKTAVRGQKIKTDLPDASKLAKRKGLTVL